MIRKDQQFLKQYAKNPSYESFINKFNDSLIELNEEYMQDNAIGHVNLHIIGAPRSGTTLLTQLLGAALNVGTINNLIASFWKAPLLGIKLSEKLLGNNIESSFESQYGRTSSITEPHEFGYFWCDLLKYEEIRQYSKSHEQNIDWFRVKQMLANMSQEFGKPVIYKSFFLGFHAERLISEMPNNIFIFVKRNTLDNAISLLKMREKYFGDINKWASIKPLQYDELVKLPWAEQIVGQIYNLERSYERELNNIPEMNKLILTYDDVCLRPKEVVDMVVSKIGQHNDNISARNTIPDEFRIVTHENIAEEYLMPLKSAIAQYYNK